MANKAKIYDKNGKFEEEITLSEKKSLLDDMLDNGVQVFFGCMGGSCSACKCRIVKGADLIDKEALGEQRYGDVKENEFLSCITRVKEGVDNKEIEIEKVL